MIPELHQNIESVLKSASPAEKLLWQQVRLICGENCAIRQLVYIGSIAGSEFVTFLSNKMYVAYSIELGTNSGPTLSPLSPYFNAPVTDALSFFYATNTTAVYNSATGQYFYYGLNYKTENIYFGRITNSGYNVMKFLGYRIIF